MEEFWFFVFFVLFWLLGSTLGHVIVGLFFILD